MSPDDDDNRFILKAMALVWAIAYQDNIPEPANLMEEFYVASYAEVRGNKCVILGSRSSESCKFEVTYDISQTTTTVIQFMEVMVYEFTDDQLNDGQFKIN